MTRADAYDRLAYLYAERDQARLAAVNAADARYAPALALAQHQYAKAELPADNRPEPKEWR